jgi:O-acetyl-ADP-ribose deacetylase (regulator of RNase III)
MAKIEYRTGDILNTDVEALVNTVNCVGVMGRGVALTFKEAFPENYKAYRIACERKEVQPGRMFVFETGYMANPKYIINFPTKRHWHGKSRIEDIDAGLKALASEIRARKIRSIALPPLGSGLGGLDWQEVRPRIERTLSTLDDIQAIVFEPREAPESIPAKRKGKPPKMTEGRAALIGLMQRYLGGLLDPFVSLLEIHKLMYFMQEAGQALRLKYVVAPYGPYAENLRHVLREIEGYYVSGYGEGGDEPDKRIELVPGAVEDAEAFLSKHAKTRSRFDRVAQLVEGFETPFGMELLSTVHWIVAHGARDEAAVVSKFYEWGDRKRQFSPRQIRMALDTLGRKNWLPAS